MFRHALDVADPPLPLLVTGVAGVPGYNALDYFRALYPDRVVGIRQTDNWRFTAPNVIACNAEDRDSLGRLFEEHRFAAVLNCAGSCALKSCELDPAMAWRINVDGVDNLLDFVAAYQARLVHLSVDLVFSGEGAGGHVETDAVSPVTVYGKTMVAAEELIARRYPRACMLRISLPMGVSFNGHAGAIDWIQSRFKKHKPATLFYDEIRTPTYTDCLNRLYARALASDLAGLYHAGGPRRLSLFEVAQIVNRVGGYDPRHLEGRRRCEAGPVPPRAGDVSLDSSRLRAALGFEPFDPWPYDERFVPTYRDWHFERSSDWQGSPALLGAVLCQNPLRRGAG